MRTTRSSPSGVFHSSSFGRGQLHTVLLWPISTAGTRSLPSSIRHRTRQSPTRYRQRPDRSAVSPLPRERGLSSFSSSDRYLTIRRASGASMAAGCFSARRESSILQPKTTPHFTKRGGGAALRKQPQQERHPPYRRCMPRWPYGHTIAHLPQPFSDLQHIVSLYCPSIRGQGIYLHGRNIAALSRNEPLGPKYGGRKS